MYVPIQCTGPEYHRHLSVFCSVHILSLVVILLLIGHVLLFLLISTYLRAIFGKHKKVPEQFHLSPEVVDRAVVGGVSEVDNNSIMCVHIHVCIHVCTYN